MEWELKPARDHGLPPGKRLSSQSREIGTVEAIVHRGWRWFLALYLHWFHGLTVVGRENLPEPPYVLIANHSSHLDALTLSSVVPARFGSRAYPIAAGDTFFTSLAASAFAAYAINALPLWRKNTKPEDLQALRARLIEDKLIYILFPEGTRSRDGSMARFKSGIGAFVAASEVPVVPCHLDGAFAALPPHRRLPRPGRLTLRIGQPLRFAEIANDRAGAAIVAERCETAVRALAPKKAETGLS